MNIFLVLIYYLLFLFLIPCYFFRFSLLFSDFSELNLFSREEFFFMVPKDFLGRGTMIRQLGIIG